MRIYSRIEFNDDVPIEKRLVGTQNSNKIIPLHDRRMYMLKLSEGIIEKK